jgi:hypothetical protein
MLEKQALGKSRHYLVGGKSEFGLEISMYLFHVGIDQISFPPPNQPAAKINDQNLSELPP